jgi:SAM-dependent methyltransferase
MGIDTELARFLLASKSDGVSFEHCATLGRQNYYLGRNETITLLREFNIDAYAYPQLLANPEPRFADPFWSMLGAHELVVIDASDYEGATSIHDMNEPVPDDLKNRFDAVCDLGTLEHVFNFPVAIRSCLEMVKPGGHLLIGTPANNQFGHGFYQFSPELFFRVLSSSNGFHLERMVAVEFGPRRKWYEVSDPELVKARVTLTNSFPVSLFVCAKKTGITPLFSKSPQQSDYLRQWTSEEKALKKVDVFRKYARQLLELAPAPARFMEAWAVRLIRTHSFRNHRSFTRLVDKR